MTKGLTGGVVLMTPHILKKVLERQNFGEEKIVVRIIESRLDKRRDRFLFMYYYREYETLFGSSTLSIVLTIKMA